MEGRGGEEERTVKREGDGDGEKKQEGAEAMLAGGDREG